MLGVQVGIKLGAAQSVAAQLRPERLERVLIQAMQKAMGLVVSAIKAAAPVGRTSVGKHLAGLLQRSIRFRVDTRRGLRARIVAAPHGHLVEGGHRLVKNGQVIGQVAAHPFARPVAEAMTPQIERAIATEMERALTLAARISAATGRPI